MNKKFILLIGAALLLVGAAIFFKSSDAASGIVYSLSNGGKLLLPLLTVSAVVDSINPCAFSILILTVAFLFSIGQMRNKILLVGGIYILGIFAAYLAIGLGVLKALHFFNTPHFMSKVGAVLLIALGLINLINEFFPKFPIKLKIPDRAHRTMATLIEKASLPTAFALGALVGLCEFPCTGGPYLMVLGLLHDQATYLSGFGYLILYNIIFVLPLIVVLFISSNQSLVAKVQAWQQNKRHSMRYVDGLVMVALGIGIYFL